MSNRYSSNLTHRMTARGRSLLRLAFALLIPVLVLLLSGSARAELSVVTSTSDLAAVAKEVGGRHVKVAPLALHTQDTHWVDARPHLVLTVSNADLLLIVGAELELGWLPTLLKGSRNADIQPGAKGYLDCSTLVPLLDVPSAKIDRSMGDIHPSGNPHYMLDPRRAERVAVGIGKRLTELDPLHKAEFIENTKRFIGALRKAREGWEKKLKDKRGEEIIAYHKSFPYLADWLDLHVVEHIEPRPGIPPNPRHVAHVIDMAREHKVQVILQESWYPKKTSQLVADKSGARLAAIPGMPNFRGGQSYVAFMDGVVARLAKAFGV